MPRCKCCKEKFIAKYFNQKFCMDNTRCIAAFVDEMRDAKWKKEKEELKNKINNWKPKVYEKKNRASLQTEINKLARMIDKTFNYLCIDCGKPYGEQIDGAHFHSVGSNSSTRYNLHNIHSAKSDCNQFSAEHKTGYRFGIVARYGPAYMNLICNLPLEFKEIHLNHNEIADKLKIVRKINRTFHTYQLEDGVSARNMFNKIIGIYN